MNAYIAKLTTHYETFFQSKGIVLKHNKGPIEKLNPLFHILCFKQPSGKYIYCTVGMSLDEEKDYWIELLIYAPFISDEIVELLTVCASFHRNVAVLNLHHTINIGQSWIKPSVCDHAFISFPFMEKEYFCDFMNNSKTISCYWLIPITEKERDFKRENGVEALEDLFETKGLDFINPQRTCLIT